jgi:hypothetical protein
MDRDRTKGKDSERAGGVQGQMASLLLTERQGYRLRKTYFFSIIEEMRRRGYFGGARHESPGVAGFFFLSLQTERMCYARLRRLLMTDSLPQLERRRGDLLAQISQLADFRPGSITSTQGRCGNPNCHCHKPDEPGHGPNLRLTYKVEGKTVTESFATPAAQRKAQREVAAFARYRELSRAFVEVNAQICRARPLQDTLSPQEKKRPKPSVRKSRAK